MKVYTNTLSQYHYLPIPHHSFLESKNKEDIIRKTLNHLLLLFNSNTLVPYIAGTLLKNDKIWIAFDENNFKKRYHSLILKETPPEFLAYYYAFSQSSFKNNDVISTFPEENAFQFNQNQLKEYINKHLHYPCISFTTTSIYIIININHFYSSMLPVYNADYHMEVTGKLKIEDFYFRKIFKHNCPINYMQLIAKDTTHLYFSIPESESLHFILHNRNFNFDLLNAY